MSFEVIIQLTLYILLFLGLLIGFLLGLKRGLVKSSIRLGTFVCFIIIAGLITVPISSALANIDISGLNWVVEGQVVKTLPEGIKSLILSSEQFSQAVNEMPSTMKLIEGLPTAIISMVVFMILVLVFTFLSWIVYVIIEKYALKQSRLERKYKQIEKKRKKQNSAQLIKPDTTQIILPKKKKYRWLGAGIGAICGFLFIFCFLVPVSSLTSTISEISSSSYVSAEENSDNNNNNDILSQTSSDLLNYYLGEETISLVNSYSQSVPGKILTLGGFDDVILDAITSINVNNEKIAFRSDFLKIAKTYDELVLLVEKIGLYENYSMIEFDKIESIVNKIFDLGLFKALAEEAVPYSLTYLYDSSSFVNFKYNEQVKNSIDKIINNLKLSKYGFVKTLHSDVLSVLNICQSACEIGLVDNLVGGVRDISTILNSLIKENNKLITSVSNNVTSSYSLKTLLTEGINIGFTWVEDKTNNELYLGEIKENLIDWNKTADSLKSIVVNTVEAFNVLDNYGFKNVVENPKIIVSNEFETSDFNLLVDLLAKQLELIKSSPLFVSQEYNVYNQFIDYLSAKEPYSNLIDANIYKQINIEQEINSIKDSIVLLKDKEILNYLFNNKIYIDELCDLLIKNDGSLENTYIPEILKPILDSKLSQKPIKYALELANKNMDTLRKEIGKEVVDINLSNFTYLSASDKEQIIILLNNFVKMVSVTGFENFYSDTLNYIFNLNNPTSSGKLNSDYFVDVIVPLSKISILNETYKSIFVAINNSEYGEYFNTSEAGEDNFDWSYELEKLNSILSILEKEHNGTSIVKMVFPNMKLEKVTITNELISKIFDNLKLPLYETMPETSSIQIFVENLYDSKILKQTLVYILNVLNEQIANIISTETNSVTLSKLTLEDLTPSQEQHIVLVFESLADCFNVLSKESFKIDEMTDEEIVLVGSFFNKLKENAYDYKDGKPNPNCVLSQDGKTVVNGGIFAELYISFINYAKQTFDFSGEISYGKIEWINFLKTAKKLSEISKENGNILDVISDPNSDVNLADGLEIIGVDKETTDKINNIQDSFKDLNSPDNFKDLSNSLGSLTQDDANKIIDAVKTSTGYDISSSIDVSYLTLEKNVSNRINFLMTNFVEGKILGITDSNINDSLKDLCCGAKIVLQKAVANGIKLNCSLSGGLSELFEKIDLATTNIEIRNLVKALFE